MITEAQAKEKIKRQIDICIEESLDDYLTTDVPFERKKAVRIEQCYANIMRIVQAIEKGEC